MTVLLHPHSPHTPESVRSVERVTGRVAVCRAGRVELVVPAAAAAQVTAHVSGDGDEATLDAILEIARLMLDWRP